MDSSKVSHFTFVIKVNVCLFCNSFLKTLLANMIKMKQDFFSDIN